MFRVQCFGFGVQLQRVQSLGISVCIGFRGLGTSTLGVRASGFRFTDWGLGGPQTGRSLGVIGDV